jgi:hypothetical protein
MGTQVPGRVARSLRQHWEPILNYFRTQELISSGVVEILNNKAKVTITKSYCFRTDRVLELASITHLASSLSRNRPTISSDEPKKKSSRPLVHLSARLARPR